MATACRDLIFFFLGRNVRFPLRVSGTLSSQGRLHRVERIASIALVGPAVTAQMRSTKRFDSVFYVPQHLRYPEIPSELTPKLIPLVLGKKKNENASITRELCLQNKNNQRNPQVGRRDTNHNLIDFCRKRGNSARSRLIMPQHWQHLL